jgi:outer membrane protein assembly factor BamA
MRGTNLDQYTWGLGAATTDNQKFKIATKYIRLYVNFNRNFRTSRVFFYGLGFNYDRFYNLVPDKAIADTPNPEKYPVGNEENLFSLGYRVSFLFDTRHNSVNPSKGTFLTLTIRNNPVLLGNRYVWTSVYFDARRYLPLTDFNTGRRQLLALWIMYWGTYGNIPYLNLPATSADLLGQSGRGYNFARFRGKEMVYAEAEYRFDISNDGLLGGVLFGNVQSFTEPDTNQFTHLLPAGGVGARIKVNKKSNTNLGLDLAWAKEGFNFSAVLGEAF